MHWSGASAGSGCGVDGAGQVVQVCALGLVESEGTGDGFEDAVGDAGEVSSLQAGVVVGANAREHGDFFAPQAGDASPAEGGKARLLRV